MNKLEDFFFKDYFSFFVIHYRFSIEFRPSFIPFEKVFLIEDILVIQQVHKAASLRGQTGVYSDKEFDNALDQMLYTNLAVYFNEFHERFFIFSPVFENRSISIKEATHEQVIFVVTCHIG